jgi:hypothetical protein
MDRSKYGEEFVTLSTPGLNYAFFSSKLCEFCGKLFGKAVKAPVAHADDEVAGARGLKQKAEQFVGGLEKLRVLFILSDIVRKAAGIEALIFGNGLHSRRLLDADEVRGRKGLRIYILENISPA